MTTNEPITIAHSSSDEIDTVTDLWIELSSEQREHGSIIRAESNRSIMHEMLTAHHVADGLLVARVDGSVVGFASFAIERGSLDLDTVRGRLSNVYVVPDYRNRGIGSALLDAVETELDDRGAGVILLEAMADNAAARRFYERHGYDTVRLSMAKSLESDS